MNRIFSDLLFTEGQNFMNRINVLGLIGTGNNSVFEIIDRETSQEYALKEIIIKEQHIYDQVLKEINLLEVLTQQQQDFVVRLKNFMICNQQVTNEYQPEPNRLAYILMEKGETSLARYIEIKKQQKQFFSVWDIRKIMRDLITGFAYLQEKKIAHMDVKPENLLIMDVSKLTIKICDIGSGLKLEQDQISMSHTIVGTIPFMAPEMIECLQNKRLASNVFKADVFSLGLQIANQRETYIKIITLQGAHSRLNVSFWILLDWTKLANQIVGQDVFIRKILQSMLLFDPSKRPDFIELNQLVLKELDNEAKLFENEIEEQIKIFENKLSLSDLETPQDLLHRKLDEVDELPKKIPKRKPSISNRQKSAKRQLGTASNQEKIDKIDKLERFPIPGNKIRKPKTDDQQSSIGFLNHQRSKSKAQLEITSTNEKTEQKQEKSGQNVLLTLEKNELKLEKIAQTLPILSQKKLDLRIHLPPLNQPKLSPQRFEPQHQINNMFSKANPLQKKISQLEPIEYKGTISQNSLDDKSLAKQNSTEEKTPQRVIKLCESSDSFISQGLCCIMKISDIKDLQKFQANLNSDFCLWLSNKIQEELDLNMLRDYLFSCGNIKKLCLKFDDMKFLKSQIIQSDNASLMSIQSLIIELRELNEVLVEFIYLILEKCKELCFFHLVIDQIKTLNLLFKIAKSLTQLQKLQSIHIQINSQGESDEKEHKNLLQIISKTPNVNDLSLGFSENNLSFNKPQWIFSDKLRYLKLNYRGNKIEKSLNSLALTLASLENIQTLDLEFSQVKATDKDLTFLIAQIIKQKQLNDLTLILDEVQSINDQFITVFLAQLSKVLSLHSISLSFIKTNVSEQSIYSILKFYEKISQKLIIQNQHQRNQFSLTTSWMLTRAEIIKFNLSNKLLFQYKIDFLSADLEWLQIVYLRQTIQSTDSQKKKYLQVQPQILFDTIFSFFKLCNEGQDFRTSTMYDCLTCSDRYSFFLNRQVTICDQCANTCHFHQENGTQKLKNSNHKAKLQKHNFLRHRGNHCYLNSEITQNPKIEQSQSSCDCNLLGICKLKEQQICTKQVEQNFKMGYRCINCDKEQRSDGFICKWCKNNCHTNHTVKEFYPISFSCQCEKDHFVINPGIIQLID